MEVGVEESLSLSTLFTLDSSTLLLDSSTQTKSSDVLHWSMALEKKKFTVAGGQIYSSLNLEIFIIDNFW